MLKPERGYLKQPSAKSGKTILFSSSKNSINPPQQKFQEIAYPKAPELF